MAYKTKLAEWLIRHRDRLHPRFTEYSWPERYFRGLHDFQAAIEVDGLRAVGRGIDADQELALEKASSEAIERLICQSLNISTEGVAVSGANGAEEHAQNESLERHYFNRHIELDHPFAMISSPITDSLASTFRKQNPKADIRFYVMATPTPINGVVCTITTKRPVPEFIGLALHHDLATVCTRAMREALANYARMMDSPTTFAAEIEARPDSWTCRPSFLATIEHLFANSAAAGAPATRPRLLIQSLDISKIKALESCPITPVRCRVEGPT